MQLIPAQNDPRTANDPQIVSQIIPGREIIPPYKVGNGVDSMRSLWMEIYFFGYHRLKEMSNSGIKAVIINVNCAAQNTKLTCVGCIKFSFAKINLNL